MRLKGKTIGRIKFQHLCSKKIYTSKRAAITSAAQQAKKEGEDIRAYKCPNARHYHIGHPPKRLR